MNERHADHPVLPLFLERWSPRAYDPRPIDDDKGGSIQGEIDALNRLIELTVPSIPMPWLEEGGTRVIPGHARIANEIDVVEYRDMLTIIRDRIMLIAEEGGTLQDVKAASVTLDYDGVYGLTSGPWTTDRFLETVFKELSAVAAKTRLSSRRRGGRASG